MDAMRFLILLLTLFSVGAHGIAPIVGRDNSKVVTNSYVVVLKKGISDAALTSHASWVDGILGLSKVASKPQAFDLNGLRGYTVQASEAVAAKLAQSDEIDYIEADQVFTIASPIPAETRKLSKRNVQANAPWGLARISHRAKGSTDYVFSLTTGTYIYVLDTGVKITHQLFGGRATFGFNAVAGSSNDDLNGHGTHVAGIASSQTYGVSRYSNIISVKVLDDSGSTTTSAVISGINWAVQDMQSKGHMGKSTAVLAVGGSKSTALNSAVAAASNSGLFFAVVAGNENADAGNFSPGSEPTACTVGGTTINDAIMPTSNWGPLVDIFAPGQNIPSLWITSNTAIATLSGTSMAAAHIAGLGAYFLALEGPRGAVALCERLTEVATKNVLTGVPSGTANLLAYNLSGL